MGEQDRVWQALRQAVVIAHESDDVPSLVRPLLDLLGELTGLEATYLTRIDWQDDTQLIELARNTGRDFAIDEGAVIALGDGLCEVALRTGVAWNGDVPGTWGERAEARELGIVTYVSVPVRTEGDELPYGTLCGASPRTVPDRAEVVSLLRVFALLIGDAIGSSRLRGELAERAEHAERLLAERVRLTATAEHVMRTPLLVAEGWTRQLRAQPDLPVEQRDEALAAIERSVRRVLAQLEDLLEAAHASFHSGRVERVDVAALAESLRPVAGGGRAYDVSGELVVVTDRDALAVLLEHLLDNVVAHTPADAAVRVVLTTAGDDAVVVVEDDGPGLPDRADLFEPFVSTDPQGSGTGLGLHVVRTIVEQLGGTVEAGAADSGGARFTLRLPA